MLTKKPPFRALCVIFLAMDRFVRKRDLVTSELQGDECDSLIQCRLAKKARQERAQYSPAAKLQWVEKFKAAGGN